MTQIVDLPSIMQVIGGVYIKSSLLDNEDYVFTEYDFTEEFHKILFGAIFNLHALGVSKITEASIENYLSSRPTKLAVYKANKGDEYLKRLKEITQVESFNYHYNRMKKMTLLRAYTNELRMDLSWLYDVNNILDIKKKQRQEEWLDNAKLEDIVNIIDEKITSIRTAYTDGSGDDTVAASTGLREMLQNLKENPDVGLPLFGSFMNTIHRGARLKTFFLRSAATNVGKTRTMIADICYIGCTEIFNKYKNEWESRPAQPALYIGTEQELPEIQRMMLAFIADVEEDHISDSTYLEGEEERVLKAVEIIENSPIYIDVLPDFSLSDIERVIKTNSTKRNIKYMFFDYIHSSIKILSEISEKARVKGLREDNVLFMLSTNLKKLCNQYGIFIMSSTQLNSDYRDAEVYDQNLLRGAKSIADKLDFGSILLETFQKDKDALAPVIEKFGGEVPEVKMSVYKNRRTKYKNILIWCRKRLGVCRLEPMFITDYNYNLIELEDLLIEVENG